MERQVIFPPLHRVGVQVPPDLRHRFHRFINEKRWTPQEGAKILLAYGAEALRQPPPAFEEIHAEWAAARAELATLRNRAYQADEAIRGLRMNITGLEASNAQFDQSLQQQAARRERLRQTLAELEAQARARGIILESEPEPIRAEAAGESLLDFWRAQRGRNA